MKITEKDLIGDLIGFPINIVEAMIEEQVKQGNEADAKVFQTHIYTNYDEGGFSWENTELGWAYWSGVISHRMFDKFIPKIEVKKERTAKPIFIIRIPIDVYDENKSNDFVNKSALSDDYHVITVPDNSIKEIKFEAFYEKDFNEVKYEELKTMIRDIMSGENLDPITIKIQDWEAKEPLSFEEVTKKMNSLK